MSDIVTREEDGGAMKPRQDTDAMLAMIERAARDPNVDVDKMERLMQMRERVAAREAEGMFATALADMQLEIPSIQERGAIRGRDGGVQSTYALWEDINDTLKPILQRYGFALSFRTTMGNSTITVTGVLSHRGGHRETTEVTLPADGSGSKNTVQAIGSSVSYGKRYAASALLNITTHGEDDDGKAAGGRRQRRAQDDEQRQRTSQRAVDPATLDWVAKIEACSTLDELETVKDEIRKKFAGMPPTAIRAACSSRVNALRAG